MKYRLVMEIDTPEEYGLTEQDLKVAIYDACEEVPFSFDVVSVEKS